MANVSLKTDFQNGDKLYDYELNNNFRAIKAALEAMNKITWQDNEEGVGVSAYKGNTEAIEARELIDGQLLYNTETGETYIDTYVDDNLVRINTGSGNVVAIQETEPENDAVKLWIEEDTLDTLDSEIVNEYSESTGLGYSANYMNEKLSEVIESGSNENGNYIKYVDGTLIQYGKVNLGECVFEVYSSYSPGLYVDTTPEGYGGSYVWNYPIAFIDTNISLSCLAHSSGYLCTSASNPSKTYCSFNYHSNYGFRSNVGLSFTAIGRWK